MKIEAIAKIDMSHNNGATARLIDFCEDLAARNRVRMWLQRTRLPPVLGSTPGLEVRLLPAPTTPERSEVEKALRTIVYEVVFSLQLAAAFLREGRSDVIYLREVATLAPGLIGVLFRVPVFVEIDGFPYRNARRQTGVLQRFRAEALRWQARLCAGIVTFSDGQREVMLQDYGVAEQRVLTIPNGADLDRFLPSPRDAAVETLGLDRDLEYVVWAGSYRPNQDLPLLLQAFARLHERRPGARLLLIAAHVAELEELSRKAGVEPWVLVRHVEHAKVPVYMAAASVCVATLVDTVGIRTNAVAPLKLFEYLACGRPTVTADVPFLRFVEERGLGSLYRPGDAESLAAALERMLSLPGGERDALGAHVRSYVEANHGWSMLNARTEEFLRERAMARGGGG